MDRDSSDSDWDSLGHDLHLLILSVLKQWWDKASLQAMMQTSRDLRLLASSLISAIEIRDASALDHYPTHAAAIKKMWLRMQPSPGEAHMEPTCMVSWLQATSSAGNRLAAVTIIEVELPRMPQPDEEDEDAVTMDPAIMDSLLASIGQACPNLRRLSMENIVREEENVIRAMLSAIGQHLPGIVELRLGLDAEDISDTSVFDFDIAGIDWAACLPRGLQKFDSSINLHHELLQQLVLMPSLTEVEVWALSINGEELLEVQSDACAWRSLTTDFPSCQALGRFTAAMPLLHLYCEYGEGPVWNLAADVERPAVAKAAAWLSQLRNPPEELSLNLISACTPGLISSLGPLSVRLVSFGLGKWPVSERTLDELATALPSVCKLTLWNCSISDSAWSRMLSLTSVTELRIYGPAIVDGSTIPLNQIIAFASAISRPFTLTFRGGCVSVEDQAGWEVFEEERKRNGGLLQRITVHITQKKGHFSDSI